MNLKILWTAGALALCLAGASRSALAHCDSLDGPVVRDARAALERGDVTPVLKWVRAHDENAIRDTFRRAMAVRGGSAEARTLADQLFFETLVRIHRAGEGEAFTGLKPADTVDSGIAAADEALEKGTGKLLATRVSDDVRAGIERRYAIVAARKAHASDSVAAGREYVEAYVDYIHFVEQVERLAAHGASHAHQEPAHPAAE